MATALLIAAKPKLLSHDGKRPAEFQKCKQSRKIGRIAEQVDRMEKIEIYMPGPLPSLLLFQLSKVMAVDLLLLF